ncbi:MAG: protein-export chaperone SecB, partial [Alphaproteobacteria bacterium]
MTEVDNNPDSGQPPSVVFNGQYLKDLSFEVPNAPGIYGEIDAPPEVTVSVNVDAQRFGENVFETSLVLNVKGQVKEKTAFIVEVTRTL